MSDPTGLRPACYDLNGCGGVLTASSTGESSSAWISYYSEEGGINPHCLCTWSGLKENLNAVKELAVDTVEGGAYVIAHPKEAFKDMKDQFVDQATGCFGSGNVGSCISLLFEAALVASGTGKGVKTALRGKELKDKAAAASVGASSERKTFSNLAPGAPIRAGGFHAVNPSSLSGVSGRYNYIVGTDGRLVIANRRFGHIDLANGGDVLAAGEFRIVQGEIRAINNASGHYKPFGPGAQAAAEEAFGNSGLLVRPGAYSEVVP
jgi:hypothetical protein